MNTPPKNGLLTTKGMDGSIYNYDYTVEEDEYIDKVTLERKPMWSFMIVENSDVFQFDIVKESTFMRVEMMTRNGCDRYRAKGIPEAFIELCHQVFGLPVGSSQRAPAKMDARTGLLEVHEQHSDDAKKVWLRLVTDGRAYRDEIQQRFFYPLK